MSDLLVFAAIAAGAMLVPGPDTFVVLRLALAGGARAGVWAAAGAAAGNVVWGAATVVGLTGLLTASDAAFAAVRLAGAAYLVVLGAQALRAAARGGLGGAGAAEAPSGGGGAVAARRAFARGLASDLANVKVGLFWTAVAPQAVAADAGPLLPAAMVATMAGIVFAWLAGYAVLAARIAGGLGSPRVGRGLNATAGVAFLALGLSLAAA